MGLTEELYFAVLKVGYAAKKRKIPVLWLIQWLEARRGPSNYGGVTSGRWFISLGVCCPGRQISGRRQGGCPSPWPCLLEVDWAAGVSIHSPPWATVSYPLALRANTTVSRVTGKALRQYKICQPQQRSLKMWPGAGWRSRPSGRSSYLPQGTFHDRNSTSPRRTRSTKLTSSFCRFKAVEPLATKEAKEVAEALSRIYRLGPLKWPKLLQVDPGREFMGAVNQLLAKHGVSVRCGRVDIHRDQGIVERFNRTLAERLFGHQYAQEMRLPSGQRSTEWVARLPAVVAALNGEVARLTC